MTEEVKAIWKTVDRISDPDIADEVEKRKVEEYLNENYFIIPEEDWIEIETRGYDLELMREKADEDNPLWEQAVNETLKEITDKEGRITEFFRGYEAGTYISEMKEV